jgi:uncharacterized cysteine cluster protein YcgN (CxxCxxCC family)
MRKCGLCCFEKYRTNPAPSSLPHASIPGWVTRECRIYPPTLRYLSGMLRSGELVRELTWLHDDCGYRKPRSYPEEIARVCCFKDIRMWNVDMRKLLYTSASKSERSQR